jgi:hypothetical protein
MRPQLESFVLHNFLARWQDVQFKQLVETLPKGCVISCVNFSKNYTMRVQNEIQNIHCHNFQVSILVHICYMKLAQGQTSEDGSRVVKEVHYYVSDDIMHDTLFVQHAFMLHWHHLKHEGSFPKVHYVWNDGCNGQLKLARAWYFVS